MDYKKTQDELNKLKSYAKFARDMTTDKMQHLMWDGMGLAIVKMQRVIKYDMMSERRWLEKKGGSVILPADKMKRKKALAKKKKGKK